uniref:Phosphoinositide phospholipase C n=1 Tax=Ditylenchus dipsaci TaxID=166011 RepID=A0A915DN67_9BILA
MQMCHYLYSLSETAAKKRIATESASMVKHCARQLLRIYPKASRFWSANYTPTQFWANGCQLVALNFQTLA